MGLIMRFKRLTTSNMAGIYSPEEREEHKALIRRIITFNPTASLRSIQTRLMKAETPYSFSLDYIMDLGREVRKDRIEQINEETKEDIYAEIKDVVEWVNQQLRAIAQEEKLVYTRLDKKGLPAEGAETRIFAQSNRIKSLNSVVDNLIKLVNLKMDLGIIERKVGTLDLNVVSVMSALKNIRNGDYTTKLPDLIIAPSGRDVVREGETN